MDIVKGNTIKWDIRKLLLIGVEKSGKTSFIATMPRPILVFGGETGAETRLGGHSDIDFVQCYDKLGEPKGAGYRRFERNFRELLTAKDLKYKTIAVDPISFLSDYLLNEIDRTNPGIRSGSTFKFWELAKIKHSEILNQILGMTQHVVVTSHVKLREDETTDKAMFLPDLNGSIRDSIGGWFDAVLFTTVVPQGQKAKYVLQAIPDARKKCGVRVPLGMEDKVSQFIEPDYNKLLEQLGGKKDGQK